MPSLDEVHVTQDGRATTVRDWILACVRNGVYPWVAAMSCGIDPERLNTWLTAPRGKYRRFAKQLAQAQAYARIKAEMLYFQDNPRQWLLNGPGRERTNREGWARTPQQQTIAGKELDLLAHPQTRQLLSAILDALTSHPEARIAVARAIEAQQCPSPTRTVPVKSGQDPEPSSEQPE